MFLQISFFSELMSKVQSMAVSFAPKIFGAVVVYIVGSFVIKKVCLHLVK